MENITLYEAYNIIDEYLTEVSKEDSKPSSNKNSDTDKAANEIDGHKNKLKKNFLKKRRIKRKKHLKRK